MCVCVCVCVCVCIIYVFILNWSHIQILLDLQWVHPDKPIVSWRNCKLKMHLRRWSQDSGGIGEGDHFLPNTFIKSSFECWATSTKQLLNAGRGHQTTRKTGQSLQKEVGQNIKDKNKDKEFRDQRRSILGRELWRRTSFHIIGNPLTGGLVGRLGISKGNIARKKKSLTNITSGEIAQKLMSASSKWGLGREA